MTTLISQPIQQNASLPTNTHQVLQIPAHQRHNDEPKYLKVDVDYLRKTHVIFAVPCYAGQVFEGLVSSFINWSSAAHQIGMEWGYISLGNESLISRGRNTLTAKFLTDHPEATHILFVDSDITFHPWHVFSMLQRNQDIVGGLYSMKTLPAKWCANGVVNAHQIDDTCHEVLTIGTGFMLIKREVFAKMRLHPEFQPYENDLGLDKKYDANMGNFFDTPVREGRFLSEDWSFCYRWRELGNRVYVDKRVILPHTGTYIYGRDEIRLTNEYGANFVKNIQQQGYTIRDEYGNTIKLD